ncbi:MAG: hypothetical protein LBT86_04670 [Deltaproteobacteria bacterium]|jgi:hypothetical protein|nr:hypothetical protein [Deltaproteobacteria bacterium]
MAKSALNWKDRRVLIDHPKTKPESMIQAGRQLLDKGYWAEAADFFRKAKDQDGLREILARAVDEGNFFLYCLATQYLGQRPRAGELIRLADQAKAAGFDVYHDQATRLLTQLRQGSPAPDAPDNK